MEISDILVADPRQRSEPRPRTDVARNDIARSDMAFREVVEQHKRSVYALAYDLTGSHHDAEDLSGGFHQGVSGDVGFSRGRADVFLAVPHHCEHVPEQAAQEGAAVPATVGRLQLHGV